MKEQLTTFDTAKLASDKGFDWKVENYFDETENNKEVNLLKDTIIRDYDYFVTTLQGEFSYEYIEKGHLQELYNIVTEDYCGDLKRPTQGLLQKWLREVHNIHISINCVLPRNGKQFEAYVCKITTQEMIDKADLSKYLKLTDLYLKYEEALEKGLYEALLLIK